jgi:hypothetical protein
MLKVAIFIALLSDRGAQATTFFTRLVATAIPY